MRKGLIVILFLTLSYPIVSADSQPESLWSLSVAPAGGYPIGSDIDFFSYRGAVDVSLDYRLRPAPFISVGADFSYNFLPVDFNTSVSVLTGGLALRFILDAAPHIALTAGCAGGYYFGFLSDGTGPRSWNPYIRPTAGFHINFAPSFSLGIEGFYNNFFGLAQDAGARLVLTLHFVEQAPKAAGSTTVEALHLLEAERAERLQIISPVFVDIFPVFSKYYDENPIGSAELFNNTDDKIENISISLYIKQYMDNPKQCAAPTLLEPGATGTIELNALFTNDVMNVTADTKASVEISANYTIGKETYRETYSQTVRIHDRNAMTWEDDSRAAAFINPKDAAVLSFSKNIAAVSKRLGAGVINANLRTAMALHAALKLFGMEYLPDPQTPYSTFSENKTTVDFLQFPRQTLQYKAGDCDDLSILVCSLLESIAIETAFITIPGHIYIAFFLGISQKDALTAFKRVEDLIFVDGEAWMPLEITRTQTGFLDAWETGAREWREASARGVAQFIPVRAAWQLYEPVWLPGENIQLEIPDIESVSKNYMAELAALVEREIYPLTAQIEAKMADEGETPALVNRMGALYARYGIIEKADELFSRALELQAGFVPALLNAGNIRLMSGDTKAASSYFNEAYQEAPDNPGVLLAVARVNHELENFGLVKDAYTKLKELKPELARRFAYLDLRGDDAERAAEIGNVKDEMIWED